MNYYRRPTTHPQQHRSSGKTRKGRKTNQQAAPYKHSTDTVSYSSITFGNSWKASEPQSNSNSNRNNNGNNQHVKQPEIVEDTQSYSNVGDHSDSYNLNTFYGNSDEQSHRFAAGPRPTSQYSGSQEDSYQGPKPQTHRPQLQHAPQFSPQYGPQHAAQHAPKKSPKQPKKIFQSVEDDFRSSPPYDFSIKNNFPSSKSKAKKFYSDLDVKNIAINNKHNKYDSSRPLRDSNYSQAPKKRPKYSGGPQGRPTSYRPSGTAADSVENLSNLRPHHHVHDKRNLQTFYNHQKKSAKRKVKELRVQRQILERRKRKLLEEEKRLAAESSYRRHQHQHSDTPEGYFMRIEY